MFKFGFEILTDPLGLPIDWVYECLILLVIGEIASRIAWNTVADMYYTEMICGKTEGSFFHWLVRLIVFTVMWAIIYGAIWLYKFIMENLQIILHSSVCILGTAIICVVAVFIMRIIKKRRMVK